MASNKTRLAVIVSQVTFDLPHLEERKGNEADVKNLQNVLKAIGFTIRKFENRKKDEILNILASIAVETYKDLECIIVIVLSHGDRGGILFAKDEELYTRDVWKPFSDCEKLNNIPKIFIFQACRGDKEEEKFSFKSPKLPTTEDVVSQTVPMLPHKPGCLIVHSTITDHLSERNLDSGTLFIRYLCLELSEAHDKKGEINFLSLLTEVNYKVTTSAEAKDGSQTPTFTSFLRQPLSLKTKEAVGVTPSTSRVSYDAKGGVVKSSYGDKGKRVILILYAEKYTEQFNTLNQVLSHHLFKIESILVNKKEDICGLSERSYFKEASSLTVIVLAEFHQVAVITGYCEKQFVKFSTLEVHLSAVWSQFTVSHCYELMGKPKIFFFCDLHDRTDHTEEGITQSTEKFEDLGSVNQHADFLWTYCYGKGMLEAVQSALCDSDEEITQLLTTAMRRADPTTRKPGGRISHFESTLRLQFYYRSPLQ